MQKSNIGKIIKKGVNVAPFFTLRPLLRPYHNPIIYILFLLIYL